MGIDVAFYHYLGVGGDFEGDCAARDEIDAAAVEEAGEEEFFDAGGEWGGGGVGEDGFAAEDDGEGHFFVAFLIEAEMACAVVVDVPVHGAFSGCELLDAIHADVAVAGFGVFGEDSAEGDVAAGAALGDFGTGSGVEDLAAIEIAVEGPALDEGEAIEVGFVAFEDDLLADAGADGFWGEGAELEEVGQLLHFLHEGGGDFGLDESLDALGEFGEGFGSEGLVNAPV